MRPFEILIAVLLGGYIAQPLLPLRRPRFFDAMPILIAALTGLQLLLEGYRWQMLPLYLLVSLTLILAAFRLARGENLQTATRLRQIAGASAGLVLLALALALPLLFPVPALPAPSGPYAVGTRTLALADTTRTEIYGDHPGGPRSLMVQIWYPAEDAPGIKLAPWIAHSDLVGRAVADWLDLPPFSLDHLQYARTHAHPDVPIALGGAPYPVLLFSHGWGGFRAQNTYQMEELASRGYVVAAVEHAYGAVITVFPDGTIARHDPATLPDDLPGDAYQQAANRLIQQWSGDLAFVLDTLAELNGPAPNDTLAGKLDLSRVGVFGHSTGGGAAIEFCAQDSRCRAVLGMDAYMTPVSTSVIASGLSQPALFLFSEAWPSPENTSRFESLFAHLQAEAWALTISGTDHYDFTDLPLLSPLAPYIGLKGPLSGPRVLEIVRDYSTAFFDKTLRGIASPVLDGPASQYPEVKYNQTHQN